MSIFVLASTVMQNILEEGISNPPNVWGDEKSLYEEVDNLVVIIDNYCLSYIQQLSDVVW